MSFDVKLEESEQLIALLSFMASKQSEAFHVAITDRALFLPRKKLFAVKDPTYCERVPLNRVIEANVKKLSPYFLWTLALIMVLVGTVTELSPPTFCTFAREFSAFTARGCSMGSL